MKDLLGQLALEFDKLRPQVVLPAKGCLKYDYLVPGGYYNEMWDWDGYFIGCHLASRSKTESVYLKWLVLNFLNLMDDQGYIPGCITPQGPEEGHRRFALKPFLAQSAYWAAKKLDDFEWLKEGYDDQKKVITYREKTQQDQQYGLFFWNHAIQSGADNNPAVGNDHTDRDMIFACDINTYQLREYLSMIKIADRLKRKEDAAIFQNKARLLEQAIQNHLWFDQDSSYYNVRRDTGQAIKRVTFSNFLPLIQKLSSPQDGSRMINKYLWNEIHLLSPCGLRSLSRQDKDYNNDTIIMPCSNFQGPVWPIINFLYAIGLKNYGFDDEASILAERIGNLVLKDIRSCGSMHENYHADTGQPLSPVAEQSPDGIFRGFVGWNLLVQNMLQGAVENNWLLLEI